MRHVWGVALLVIQATADAQQRDSSERVAKLVAQTRAATERFKDIEVAISENYVKVGPDFPAMGEHWVRGESVMKSVGVPMPAILTYASIDGKPTLTGAVYTLILKPGEKPPSGLPAGQWHDHVGTVDEESLLIGHDHLAAGESDSLRLSVMHAWVWVANPAGAFVTDNWALPFARLGVTPPPNASKHAAEAISLATSSSYWSRLFDAVGALNDTESDAVLDAVEAGRDSVQKWMEGRKKVGPEDVAWLERTWMALGDRVTRSVRAESAARLKHLFEHDM
jgi:hypothetical protein